jgi:hypothetical protein
VRGSFFNHLHKAGKLNVNPSTCRRKYVIFKKKSPSNSNSPPGSIAFSQAMTRPDRPTTGYSCNAADGPFFTTRPPYDDASSVCTACLAGFPKYKEMISDLNRTDEMTGSALFTLQFSSIQFIQEASLPVIIGAMVGGIAVIICILAGCYYLRCRKSQDTEDTPHIDAENGNTPALQLTPARQPQHQDRQPEPIPVGDEDRDVLKISLSDLELAAESLVAGSFKEVFVARLRKTMPGTSQFTCFTITKVQILTPDHLRTRHRTHRT